MTMLFGTESLHVHIVYWMFMWQQKALNIRMLPLHDCWQQLIYNFYGRRLSSLYNAQKDILLKVYHVCFIYQVVFICCWNLELCVSQLLPRLRYYCIGSLTDQIRGQRKSIVLFKLCKSWGLVLHFLLSCFFFPFLKDGTSPSHINLLEKDSPAFLCIVTFRIIHNIVVTFITCRACSMEVLPVDNPQAWMLFNCICMFTRRLAQASKRSVFIATELAFYFLYMITLQLYLWIVSKHNIICTCF